MRNFVAIGVVSKRLELTEWPDPPRHPTQQIISHLSRMVVGIRLAQPIAERVVCVGRDTPCRVRHANQTSDRIVGKLCDLPSLICVSDLSVCEIVRRNLSRAVRERCSQKIPNAIVSKSRNTSKRVGGLYAPVAGHQTREPLCFPAHLLPFVC